ncbi:MAG: hypothetical protein Q8L84_00945 [Hyphomonas sp.]|nr:hypothetical protein [Hyphomonas sp.]
MWTRCLTEGESAGVHTIRHGTFAGEQIRAKLAEPERGIATEGVYCAARNNR